MNERAVATSITIPRDLKEKADQQADELNFVSDLTGEINFSAYVRYAIRQELEDGEYGKE